MVGRVLGEEQQPPRPPGAGGRPPRAGGRAGRSDHQPGPPVIGDRHGERVLWPVIVSELIQESLIHTNYDTYESMSECHPET